MSTVSGLIITWTGRYRELLLLGWTLWSVGLGLISTLNQDSGMGKQIGYCELRPLACLPAFPPR